MNPEKSSKPKRAVFHPVPTDLADKGFIGYHTDSGKPISDESLRKLHEKVLIPVHREVLASLRD